VLGLYRMGKKEMLAFSEGASINTDDGAELEFSAPKNVRRATSDLNAKLMEPYLVDAPLLKSNDPLVPRSLHHFYLAEIYEANGGHGRALEEVDKAIRSDSSNPDFHVLKTKILLEQERSGEAAKSALLALERSSRTIKPILALSEDFYVPDAKQVYTRIIRMGTREIIPYIGLGNIALYADDLKEAEKWLAGAREIKPEHPAVLLAWGRLLFARGEPEKAKEFLEKSRAKGEDSATLHGALGATYAGLELWGPAVDSYGRAVRLRRKNPEWRRSLGNALAQSGRPAQAEEKLREVLALSPSDVEACKELRKLRKRC
ncbi:MAG: tetratricopeptide repeat protein, partial [Candidatus Binatia bacterium]